MKQLIIFADMEGASGIFDRNWDWFYNGGENWREFGRKCLTSDVLAVCRAASDFGIDDVLLYDGHYAGNAEFNVILEELPPFVRVFDIFERRIMWRRIRGQAATKPFGLITVGQHARYGTENAYFPHTIQSPPIKAFRVNGIHVAEIGMAALSFEEVPYIANIGCAASMAEARELVGGIAEIAVKDKARGWEPTPEETFPIIYDGVSNALKNAENARVAELDEPFEFALELCEGYWFDKNFDFPWKGEFDEAVARWVAPSVPIGLEIFDFARGRIVTNK